MSQKTLVSQGRFVILLHGRHAGKKAVVLSAFPEPTEIRKYPHAIVLGVEKAPKPLTKDMTQEQMVKRTQVKCFIKIVNFNHLLLTRHVLKEEDFWTKIKINTLIPAMDDAAQKKANLEEVSKILRQKYLNNKMPWLFKPLQF